MFIKAVKGGCYSSNEIKIVTDSGHAVLSNDHQV